MASSNFLIKLVAILTLVILAAGTPSRTPMSMRATERTERQKYFCKWTMKLMCHDANPKSGYEYHSCIINALVFDKENCGFHTFDEYNPCVVACKHKDATLAAECVSDCVFGQPLSFSNNNWTNWLAFLEPKLAISYHVLLCRSYPACGDFFHIPYQLCPASETVQFTQSVMLNIFFAKPCSCSSVYKFIFLYC